MAQIYQFPEKEKVTNGNYSSLNKLNYQKISFIGFFLILSSILFAFLNSHVGNSWALWFLFFIGINIIGCITVITIIIHDKINNKKPLSNSSQ